MLLLPLQVLGLGCVTVGIFEGLGDLARPDQLGQITVVFNQRVSLTSNALRIFNDSDGGTPVSLDGAEFSLSEDGRTATWNLLELKRND